MFIKYIFIKYIFIILQIICVLSKPREYTRIPKNLVHDRIYTFLERNGINNCYDHLDDPTLLLLKCFNDELFDVEISIQVIKPNNKYISVYI